MKFSYNWLKEYIPQIPEPKDVADLLGRHAFEVSGFRKEKGDTILDIDILPNRMPDASGHVGLAQEIAAITNLAVKRKNSDGKITSKKLKEKDLGVNISDRDAVLRYHGAIVEKIIIKPSPKWLKDRLETLGIHSINNVVDITNYVMLEYGQPLHAFDYHKIHGSILTIRQARAGEVLQTLDGTSHTLEEGILVIADKDRIIDLAGIMGGENSAVDSKTKTIFLQVAAFEPTYIHRASRVLKKRTEASIRYTAGLDPNLTSPALQKALVLLEEWAGGKVKGIVDIYPQPTYPRRIMARPEKVNQVLGSNISEEDMIKILTRLSCTVRHLKSTPREEIVAFAKTFIGRPYAYGASVSREAPHRFDCSGFLLYLFRQIGKEIPRVSIDQYRFAREISDEALMPGDVVFAKGSKPHRRPGLTKDIGHIALYIGDGEIIHASSKKGKVVVESLVRFKENEYRGAGRILDDLPSQHLVVTVPTRRRDLVLEEDLIEEVGRIYGYDMIEARPPIGELVSASVDRPLFFREKIGDLFKATGFDEVRTYSFIGEKEVENLGAFERSSLIEIANPRSREFRYLRPLLLPSLLSALAEASKVSKEIRYVNSGRIYRWTSNGYRDTPDLERSVIAFAIMYKTKAGKDVQPFFELKGALDGIFKSLGLHDVWYDSAPSSPEILTQGVGRFLHPYQFSEIKLGEKKFGMFGILHPELTRTLGIQGQAAVGEMFLDEFISEVEKEKEYRPISKYPAVTRDLSILVPWKVKVIEVLDVIENTGGELLVDTDLFDVYEGSEIGAEKKNFAFHLIFQSSDRTLKDSEIDLRMEKIINALKENIEWEVRE